MGELIHYLVDGKVVTVNTNDASAPAIGQKEGRMSVTDEKRAAELRKKAIKSGRRGDKKYGKNLLSTVYNEKG